MPDAVRDVAVVGADSAVGAALVAALLGAPGTGRVVAVHDTVDPPDVVPPGGSGATVGSGTGTATGTTTATLTVRAVDVASPQVLIPLEGVDVVVLVAVGTDLAGALAGDAPRRRARARATAQAVTTAAAAVGARQLVVVSSAMVLGTGAEHLLADDAERRAGTDDGLVGDLLVVEEVLDRARWAHPGLRVAVLRPTALVGPGIDTVATRHFAAPRLLTLRERAPAWQFCSLSDLCAAVLVVLTAGLAGPLGVGSDGTLDQDAVEAITGLRRVELSDRQASATAERLARRGVLMSPATDLAHVVHPQSVSATGLRAAGWTPLETNEECLRSLVAELERWRTSSAAGGGTGRGAERPGAGTGASGLAGGVATAGAAGATVALVATAALVRQARARRRGRA